MKIDKYLKQSSGMYQITLDNGTKFKIHEDLILKYGLLLTKEVDDKLLESIRIENNTYEIYGVALKSIKTRMRSRKEIKELLNKKGFDGSSIDDVVALLDKQGYLNDELFASSFVHDKILMTSFGPNRIKGELERLGIGELVISKALENYTEEMEKERIDKIIKKMIKSNHNKGSYVLKQKIQANLINLGYHFDMVAEIMQGTIKVDRKIGQKEYDKIVSKLSKKYSGNELEYRVKQKMYQKGFSDFE